MKRFTLHATRLLLVLGFVGAFAPQMAQAAVRCDCVITTTLRGEAPHVYPPVSMTGEREGAIDGGECQELRGRVIDALIAGGGDLVDSNQTVNNCHDLEEEAVTPTTSETGAPTIHTPAEYGYVNPLGTTNIRTIINRVIRAALGFVGALFLAMFVYGGALWMTAAGDEKKVQSAKTTLRNAVIGILLIGLSYGLISIIFEFAGQVRSGGTSATST